MKRARKVLVATAALALAPSAAFAVNVSSSDGSGNQARSASYSNGAKVTGTLRSTNGNTVYYSGQVIWYQWYCSNTSVDKYSRETSSMSSVSAGGNITNAFPGGCTAIKVKSEVCRNIQGLPDPCGSWSADY